MKSKDIKIIDNEYSLERSYTVLSHNLNHDSLDEEHLMREKFSKNNFSKGIY